MEVDLEFPDTFDNLFQESDWNNPFSFASVHQKPSAATEILDTRAILQKAQEGVQLNSEMDDGEKTDTQQAEGTVPQDRDRTDGPVQEGSRSGRRERSKRKRSTDPQKVVSLVNEEAMKEAMKELGVLDDQDDESCEEDGDRNVKVSRRFKYDRNMSEKEIQERMKAELEQNQDTADQIRIKKKWNQVRRRKHEDEEKKDLVNRVAVLQAELQRLNAEYKGQQDVLRSAVSWMQAQTGVIRTLHSVVGDLQSPENADIQELEQRAHRVVDTVNSMIPDAERFAYEVSLLLK